MSLERNALLTAFLFLGLGLATTANAGTTTYPLGAGSGAQLHIGGGLALPIQPAATALVTGMVFPPLLIPPVAGTITATTTKGADRAITVMAGALSLPAAQKTVGVFFSNPTLYAVGTNLKFTWPTATAMFSTAGAPRAVSATAMFAGTKPGNSMRYSERVVGKRFGGAGRFAIAAGAPAGILPGPVTIYALAVPGPGAPPCTHSALTPAPFPGPGNGACLAAVVGAAPAPIAAPGGTVANLPVTTPGVAISAGNVHLMKVGTGSLKPAGPLGTISFVGPGVATGGGTNMAKSTGRPWTTGMLTISASTAKGAPEAFTISGNDQRTPGGSGVVQMVSGAMSDRAVTGPNANRAWLRLEIGTKAVSALSPAMLAAGAGLLMLAAGYVVRRSASASV